MIFIDAVWTDLFDTGLGKKATSKSPGKKKSSGKDEKVVAKVYIVSPSTNEREIFDLIGDKALDWQKSTLQKSSYLWQFSSDEGPIWILRRQVEKSLGFESDHLESNYTFYRDQAAGLYLFVKGQTQANIELNLVGTDFSIDLGVMIGLNYAAYSYKPTKLQDLPKVKVTKQMPKSFWTEVRARSLAINLARHLVNTPPNLKQPQVYAAFVQKLFAKRPKLKVELWKKPRLLKEGMGLHWGVGQGSESEPVLVTIKYRPGRAKSKPIAFVGKGITFDTGGLDIKPSSGMRLMKKDMGGSAAILGVALWAQMTQYPGALDFYLPLAENSVDAKSFRPSDVIKARNGMTVEIHNTDAEGRLVLADALDVAVTQKEKPQAVIDVATLTGAIKVALGNDIAGLFSNNDKLAEELITSGQEVGDYSWRMPLYQRYTNNMTSHFADIVNAVDSPGGAITAALFLQKFVKDVPWAHLDIYAWNDRSGGSGQGVQALIEYLNRTQL